MDDDTEYDDADLGPWREPLDDDTDGDGEEGDGECFVAMSQHNARGYSRCAAVERWLRLPHHYSLREYIEAMEEHAASNKADTAENRRSR